MEEEGAVLSLQRHARDHARLSPPPLSQSPSPHPLYDNTCTAPNTASNTGLYAYVESEI